MECSREDHQSKSMSLKGCSNLNTLRLESNRSSMAFLKKVLEAINEKNLSIKLSLRKEKLNSHILGLIGESLCKKGNRGYIELDFAWCDVSPKGIK